MILHPARERQLCRKHIAPLAAQMIDLKDQIGLEGSQKLHELRARDDLVRGRLDKDHGIPADRAKAVRGVGCGKLKDRRSARGDQKHARRARWIRSVG